mmetsp:Transcript_68771/g.213321  ORF Transcript_68771/g.213321 Transcript_68771/m.213321 type:complete len:429 (-) Transcript_68771:50-1336(-)
MLLRPSWVLLVVEASIARFRLWSVRYLPSFLIMRGVCPFSEWCISSSGFGCSRSSALKIKEDMVCLLVRWLLRGVAEGVIPSSCVAWATRRPPLAPARLEHLEFGLLLGLEVWATSGPTLQPMTGGSVVLPSPAGLCGPVPLGVRCPSLCIVKEADRGSRAESRAARTSALTAGVVALELMCTAGGCMTSVWSYACAWSDMTAFSRPFTKLAPRGDNWRSKDTRRSCFRFAATAFAFLPSSVGFGALPPWWPRRGVVQKSSARALKAAARSCKSCRTCHSSRRGDACTTLLPGETRGMCVDASVDAVALPFSISPCLADLSSRFLLPPMPECCCRWSMQLTIVRMADSWAPLLLPGSRFAASFALRFRRSPAAALLLPSVPPPWPGASSPSSPKDSSSSSGVAVAPAEPPTVGVSTWPSDLLKSRSWR